MDHHSKQTLAAANSFITSLMQFVGSGTSALTCLFTLFLEHLVAPCLCSSAVTSGTNVRFFFFFCTPWLFCCISAFYHLRSESCFRPCSPPSWRCRLYRCCLPQCGPRCPRIKSVFAALPVFHERRKRQSNVVFLCLSNDWIVNVKKKRWMMNDKRGAKKNPTIILY